MPTPNLSRREFVATMALGCLSKMRAAPLDGDWLFGGQLSSDAPTMPFDNATFNKVTLPHCVTKLSWQNWDPTAWQHNWAYQKHFALPAEFRDRRTFLEFEGVMTGTTAAMNGHALPAHLGGYLPFRYEVTEWMKPGDNILSVIVDGRWKDVPPEGSPKGTASVDYLEPAGIHRPVNLHSLPQTFISDVFAKPVKILDPARSIEVTCTINSTESKPAQVRVALLDRGRTLATAQQNVPPGSTVTQFSLTNLGNINLWHPDHPQLYDFVTTLLIGGKPVHDHRTRIGFREARFDVDGFFLNGERYHLFGLNRHEIYPYTGAAMSPRVHRRDAEILRHDFNCNVVRCSHYPQSDAFLDACDELGLMVWEELPGWQYVGGVSWKELAVRDVREMIRRDRNRPSVIIWGVRVNESANDPELYSVTTQAAHELDGTRPASGSMTPSSQKDWKERWHEDVYAFDDYHANPDHTVGIFDPLPGVPYMLAETVGQFNYTKGRVFDAKYLRTADLTLQQAQALRHAQAHDRAMGRTRMAGTIAWCAFDYGSQINAYHNVKTPGVADVFRIPKLGASFYQAQGDPKVRAVIVPNFYWDPQAPVKNAAIFSNCDRLEVFVDGKSIANLQPDRAGFPHIKFPPFFCDLAGDGDLRIDGYLGTRRAVSRSFSQDKSKDQFVLTADDASIKADGSDSTRIEFKITDRFANLRSMSTGDVAFRITGPGEIIGDNPFQLDEAGGVGAIWVKSKPKAAGRITVMSTHSVLGTKSVTITAS